MVTCGGRHTIAVTDEGDVFTWGLGHFGCLGRSFTRFDYDADAAVVAFTSEDGNQPLQADNNGEAAPQEQIQVPVVERNFAAELREHLELLANMTLDDSSDQCIPQPVESLKGINIVSASAGHRHSLFLEEGGALYSCGAGTSGCLGHGDTASQMFPMKITALDEGSGTRITQMSAGVDMSMAVDNQGQVYAWGKMDGGRIGLGLERKSVTIPRQVPVSSVDGESIKAIDVECGYVHSLIVGIDGSIHLCGGVGIEGADDGQVEDNSMDATVGKPRQVPNLNIWQRVIEAKEAVKKERWSKYGKYTVKGRTKMLQGDD
jgi:alpha-tubulin suppressor-like RCC1 family protein